MSGQQGYPEEYAPVPEGGQGYEGPQYAAAPTYDQPFPQQQYGSDYAAAEYAQPQAEPWQYGQQFEQAYDPAFAPYESGGQLPQAYEQPYEQPDEQAYEQPYEHPYDPAYDQDYAPAPVAPDEPDDSEYAAELDSPYEEFAEIPGQYAYPDDDVEADLPAPDAEPLPLSRRVPVWHPPGLVPAVLTAGLAGVLVVSALAGGPATVAGVAFLQVLTAVGWFRLHGMWPARQGIALAVLAGGAADVAVLVADNDALRILPGVLAGVLGLVLLQQLARRDGRPELLPALTVTASAALLTVLDVLFVLAARVEGPGVRDGALVAVGAGAVAAAVLPAALPLPAIAGTVLGLAAAAAIGAAGGSMLDLGSTAVLLGVGAGVMGLLGRRLAGYDHPSRFVHMTAGVALPLALAAPAVYLLGRVAIG